MTHTHISAVGSSTAPGVVRASAIWATPIERRRRRSGYVASSTVTWVTVVVPVCMARQRMHMRNHKRRSTREGEHGWSRQSWAHAQRASQATWASNVVKAMG